jgi:hypothetical protein
MQGFFGSPAFAFMFFGLCLLALAQRVRNSFRAKASQQPDGLDTAIFRWDDYNCLTIRNLLAGGIHAYGRTDAGKSSSMRQIAKAILQYGDSSLLVLCPKKGEYRDWLAIAKACGREKDVALIDPSQPHRLNMIGYWTRAEGGAENVVRFIMEMKSAIFREAQSAGGESTVWRKYDETAIRNCVIALMCAGEEVTAINLHRLLISAPTLLSEIATEAWQRGYCNEVIRKGFSAALSSTMRMDFEQAKDYLVCVWPSMGDRTRGSVLMGVAGTLSAMNIGIAREMFAQTTTITPKEAIEGRKIVVINMSPDEYGDVGMLANIGWKYLWQKEILKRQVSDGSPIAGVWGDESSMWLSDFDSDFVSRCRSYRGFQIYISQSLASYQKALPDKAEAVVESLLSNFSHKLMFAVGDYQTAEWAANLCGKELQILSGGSVQHQPFNLFDENGNDSHSSSFHEQYEYLMRPEEFMSGFRTGSPVNDFKVDAVLLRAGKTFTNGLPLLRITFDQRH